MYNSYEVKLKNLKLSEKYLLFFTKYKGGVEFDHMLFIQYNKTFFYNICKV